jgi:hypothetical protein
MINVPYLHIHTIVELIAASEENLHHFSKNLLPEDNPHVDPFTPRILKLHF